MTATIVQDKHTTNASGFAEAITLDSPVTVGNLLLAIGEKVGPDDLDALEDFTSLTAQVAVDDCCGNPGGHSGRVFAFAKIADSTSAGPYRPLPTASYYVNWHLYEITDADIDAIDVLSAGHVAASGATTHTLDLGAFTDATGLALFAGVETRSTDQAAFSGSWSQSAPWVEDGDHQAPFGGTHLGVGHADVTAETLAAAWDYTETASGQGIGEMAGIALLFPGLAPLECDFTAEEAVDGVVRVVDGQAVHFIDLTTG